MNKTFSANMLKTFEESPEKYKLVYEDKIFMPQNTAVAESGKNLHALINYYFKGFDISKLLPALNDNEKTLWNNFLKLNILPKSVYKTEYTFNHKIDKTNWLTGRIDAIIENSENFIIYDWKTGNLPKTKENDTQSAVYLFCMFNKLFKENLLKNHEQLSFVYVNLKNSEIFEIALTPEKYESYKEYIFRTIKKIQNNSI